MTTILVIDDDAYIQRIVRRVAESAGLEVLQALDGPPGLELAMRRVVDLIVLDMDMPMDGRDVLAQLKREPMTADVPVLVFSSCDDQGCRMQGYDLGADDYVAKPFIAELLIHKIVRMVEKHRADLRKTEIECASLAARS